MLNKTEPTQSFDALIVTHLPMLRRYAISLTRDTVHAEDLVQDTVLRACANKDKFEPGTNFAAWLTVVCKNRFLSAKRKKSEIEDPDNMKQAMLADEHTDPEEQAGGEGALVARVLSSLPNEQKGVITDLVDGLTYKQIAKKHRIEEGTVKSRVNRAREQLGIVSPRQKRRARTLIGGESRFRKISIVSFAKPPQFETELGKRPQLMWLPITRLFIDESYQRNILERGVSNVYRIVKDFDWKKFAAVVCAKVDDMYAIVDGQHRTYAAAIRGIEEIPCLVIEATTQEQAAAFAAINARTTRIDEMQVFHAAVMAGEAEAVEVARALAEANVTVHRYHCPEIRLKPRETLAVGTVRKVARLYGSKVLTLALKCINERHYNDSAVLRAPVIHAMADVVARLNGASQKDLLESAKKVNFARELIEAKVKAAQDGVAVRHVLFDILLEKFGEMRADGNP